MSTKGELVTQISTDMIRSDLSAVIGQAVDDAVKLWQPVRFFFNETRDCTFTSVAAQKIYNDTDTPSSPKISEFQTIDRLWVEVSSVRRPPLLKRPYDEIEYLADTNAASGEPRIYARWKNEIWVYPIPEDTSITFRIAGHYRLPGPTSNGETSNPWMLHAYQLIRWSAQALVYGLARYKDPLKKSEAQNNELRELNLLLARGGDVKRLGKIRRSMPL